MLLKSKDIVELKKSWYNVPLMIELNNKNGHEKRFLITGPRSNKKS